MKGNGAEVAGITVPRGVDITEARGRNGAASLDEATHPADASGYPNPIPLEQRAIITLRSGGSGERREQSGFTQTELDTIAAVGRLVEQIRRMDVATPGSKHIVMNLIGIYAPPFQIPDEGRLLKRHHSIGLLEGSLAHLRANMKRAKASSSEAVGLKLDELDGQLERLITQLKSPSTVIGATRNGVAHADAEAGIAESLE